MKTLKIVTVLSLALIVIGVNAVYSKSKNVPNKSQAPGRIQYQVNIHPASDLCLPLPNLFVVMTDEIGRLVAPAQLFTMGKSVYNFSETQSGSVRYAISTRMARLVLPSESWQLFRLYPYPDCKTGTFSDGNIYQFNLYPVPTTKN